MLMILNTQTFFSDIQDMHISPHLTRLGYSKICAQFFIFSPVCNEVKNPLYDGFSSGNHHHFHLLCSEGTPTPPSTSEN